MLLKVAGMAVLSATFNLGKCMFLYYLMEGPNTRLRNNVATSRARERVVQYVKG